ncbi:hypothetical protein ACIBEA_16705 [Streptomyces sp. NPDC051555]|uniref:hypothetical protein n=1 Tax=Streptomyces sp. NPDC051555 TaxID=3365657 RepID=UPI00378BF57A
MLRAVCVCGWSGTRCLLDRERIGDTPLYEDEPAHEGAARCRDDWDRHIETVEESTIAFPAEVDDLLAKLTVALNRLVDDEPAGALKTESRLEILARSNGYDAAHIAGRSREPEEVGAALGINADQAEDLLAHNRSR